MRVPRYLSRHLLWLLGEQPETGVYVSFAQDLGINDVPVYKLLI